jgi:hypothetical protein
MIYVSGNASKHAGMSGYFHARKKWCLSLGRLIERERERD